MDNKEQNIWSKVGSKIRNYQSDAYEDAEWSAMEDLLITNGKASFWTLANLLKWFGTLILIGSAFYFFGWNDFSQGEEQIAKDEVEKKEISIEQKKEAPEQLEEALKKTLASNSNAKVQNSIMENTISTKWTAAASKKTKPKQSNPIQKNNGNQNIFKETEQAKNGNPVEEFEANQIKTTRENSAKKLENRTNAKSLAITKTSQLEETAMRRVPQETLFFLATKSLRPLVILEAQPDFAEAGFPDMEQQTRPNRQIFGHWKAGIAVGLTTAITDYQDISFSVTPHLGFFISHAFNRHWEIQAEAHYKSVRNYELTQFYEEDIISSLGVVGHSELTFTYQRYSAIEIPLVAKYALNDRFGILSGIRYSLLSSQNTKVSTGSNASSATPLISRVPQKGFWDKDIGFILGFEYYVTPKWRLDLRYNQGFRDITPDNLYQDSKNHFNSDLQISIHRIF